MFRTILTYAIILAIALIIGCSSGDLNPAGPITGEDTYEYRAPEGEPGHCLLGLYNLYIDTVAMTVDVVPIRTASPHIDVTEHVIPPKCDDCLIIVLKNFNTTTRVATVEVTLRNPTPYPGYDVMGILMLNDAGHDLLFPDGWVSIWDDELPPYFNPFMRFGESNDFGEFPSGGEIKETYSVIIPKPPQYSAITFAIDAFWPKNGPREPYRIKNKQVNGTLYSDGSNSITFSCIVLDRNDDVQKVTIECSELFTGTKDLSKNGDYWEIEFSNENLAPASAESYTLTLEAYDSVVSYTLRDIYPLYIAVPLSGWQPGYSMVEISSCTTDIAGLTASGMFEYGGFLADPVSNCAAINKFDMTFMLPESGLNLENINPLNMTLQPFPPVRIDSAVGGSLACSNSAEGMFIDGLFSVPLNQTVVMVDGDYIFFDDGLGDDQAHYPLYANTLGVVDVCNGFEARLYSLWAENGGDHMPVFKGYKANFSTKKMVVNATIPAEFIGEGEGLIVNNVNSLLAIDAFEVEDSPPIENVELYILEKTEAGAEVEVFNIYTDPVTKVSIVTHIMTIPLPSEDGDAIDLELLPPNPDYEPNPDAPSLVVLTTYLYDEIFPGGYATIYSTADGSVVDNIGSTEEQQFQENLQHMDIIDGNHTIIVTSEIMGGGGVLNIFLFTYI